MGIDLVDLNEIISALKGNKEPLEKAVDKMLDDLFAAGSDFLDDYLLLWREVAVDRILKRWWPNAPAWVKPILQPIAEALVDAIMDALKKAAGE